MKRVLLSLISVATLAACSSMNSAPTYEAKGWHYDARQPADDRTGHELYTLDTHGRRSISALERCGGTAGLFQSGDDNQWYLRIRNSDCANIEIDGQREEKMAGSGPGSRYADVRMIGDSNRARVFRITVKSNSGKNSDIMKVTVRPTIPTATNGQTLRLDDCGGTVTMVKQNGQVNFKFQGVSSCNKFDIVSDDGMNVYYPAKTFPGSSASFTLPQANMNWGSNRVLIQVRSADGWVEDKFYASFFAW